MRIHVCKENGQIFELHAPKNWHCEKIKIDGELIIDNNVEKCDFALLLHNSTDEKKNLYFIELKGTNVKKAFSQLEQTILQLRQQPRFMGYAKQEAHAVCSAINPRMTTQIQNEALRFKLRYQFTLKAHSQKVIVQIKPPT